MCMSQALLALNDYKVILVSKDIDREEVERLGFLLAEDLDKAFAMAAGFVSNPDVHIIPAGGVILPKLLADPTPWANGKELGWALVTLIKPLTLKNEGR